jgi:steroid 5-alpha reductase family enzyme
MKNSIHFLLTCFISTGALLGATKSTNPWPYFTVTLIVWLLFAWRVSARRKRRTAKSEEVFREHMRSKFDR